MVCSYVNMEDLSEVCKQLSLNDEERVEIEVQTSVDDELREFESRSLLGRICSHRFIGKEVIQSTIMKIWKVNKAITFREIISNTLFPSSLQIVKIETECCRGACGSLMIICSV